MVNSQAAAIFMLELAGLSAAMRGSRNCQIEEWDRDPGILRFSISERQCLTTTHIAENNLLEASVHGLQFFARELCGACELVDVLWFTPHSICLSVV